MNLGPAATIPYLADFDSLGEKAFRLYGELLEKKLSDSRLSQAWHQLFLRIAYQGRSTSSAIRLNNSYGLTLPAFCLLRVRLEQAIVGSYLIHEETGKGVYPFMIFTTIKEHKNQEACFEIPAVKELLKQFDPAKSLAAAQDAQRQIRPDFVAGEHPFQREWTTLDLRSMAKRRDVLVKAAGGFKMGLLENDYLVIYKTASSVVHSDCSSYSSDFLDFVDVGGRPTLLPSMFWGLTSASLCANYDILQFYETLRFLGVECQKEFEALQGEWLGLRDRHLPEKDEPQQSSGPEVPSEKKS